MCLLCFMYMLVCIFVCMLVGMCLLCFVGMLVCKFVGMLVSWAGWSAVVICMYACRVGYVSWAGLLLGGRPSLAEIHLPIHLLQPAVDLAIHFRRQPLKVFEDCQILPMAWCSPTWVCGSRSYQLMIFGGVPILRHP